MEQQKQTKVIWIVILFIFLCIGVLSFFANDLIDLKRENDSKRVSLDDKPSVTGTVNTLLSKSSYQEKSIKSSSTVDRTNLSREEELFILDDAKNLVVYKEMYDDGKDGLNIQYEIDNNLLNSYNSLLKISRTNPYNSYFASRGNLASLINTEGDGRDIRIVLKFIDEKTTKIEVKIQ